MATPPTTAAPPGPPAETSARPPPAKPPEPVSASEKPVRKPLPPPFPVSPTIKFFRWTLLIAGIIYGSVRHSHLAAKEAIIREEYFRKKAIRDQEIAEHKRQMSERDIEMLSKMMK